MRAIAFIFVSFLEIYKSNRMSVCVHMCAYVFAEKYCYPLNLNGTPVHYNVASHRYCTVPSTLPHPHFFIFKFVQLNLNLGPPPPHPPPTKKKKKQLISYIKTNI